jgi:hypothetical protein
MPPSGDYLLHIALVAARATANEMMKKNRPTFLAISMDVAVHWYNTMHISQWRRSRASIEAIGRRHWASIAVNRCNWSSICRFLQVFSSSTHKKSRELS